MKWLRECFADYARHPLPAFIGLAIIAASLVTAAMTFIGRHAGSEPSAPLAGNAQSARPAAPLPAPPAVTIVGSPVIGPARASATGNGPHLADSGTPAGMSPHAPSAAATPSRPAPSRPERPQPAPSGSAWEAVTPRRARSAAARPGPCTSDAARSPGRVGERPASSLALTLIALIAPVAPASSIRPMTSSATPSGSSALLPSSTMPPRRWHTAAYTSNPHPSAGGRPSR